MILVLGNIVLLIIGIVLLIIGHRYDIKHEDKYEYVDSCCGKTTVGSVFTIINGLFTILFVLVALIAHTTFDQDHKRIELEEKRVAIIQELSREDDILLQGINDAKDFNTELRYRQRQLDSPMYNWLTSPVWNEFETIEY